MALFDSIEPNGTTPTGTRLEILLLEYMDQIEEYKDKGGKEPKKRNVSKSCETQDRLASLGGD